MVVTKVGVLLVSYLREALSNLNQMIVIKVGVLYMPGARCELSAGGAIALGYMLQSLDVGPSLVALRLPQIVSCLHTQPHLRINAQPILQA